MVTSCNKLHEFMVLPNWNLNSHAAGSVGFVLLTAEPAVVAGDVAELAIEAAEAVRIPAGAGDKEIM